MVLVLSEAVLVIVIVQSKTSTTLTSTRPSTKFER